MKPISFTFSIGVALLTMLSIAAAPEHPAIAQYRAYATAVRAGDEKALLKLAAPVSKENQPLQLAHIRCMIAMEQLRKETVAQLGPIDYKNDDGWMGTGIFPEDKELKAIEQNGWAGIMAKNPETGQIDLPIAIMKKVNGAWLMPLGMDLNTEGEGKEKNQPYIEPKDAEERDALLQEFTSHTKAAPLIIKRLQKKEFTTRAQVLTTLTELESKARGQADK